MLREQGVGLRQVKMLILAFGMSSGSSIYGCSAFCIVGVLAAYTRSREYLRPDHSCLVSMTGRAYTCLPLIRKAARPRP
jgi:hypothetical protein